MSNLDKDIRLRANLAAVSHLLTDIKPNITTRFSANGIELGWSLASCDEDPPQFLLSVKNNQYVNSAPFLSDETMRFLQVLRLQEVIVSTQAINPITGTYPELVVGLHTLDQEIINIKYTFTSNGTQSASLSVITSEPVDEKYDITPSRDVIPYIKSRGRERKPRKTGEILNIVDAAQALGSYLLRRAYQNQVRQVGSLEEV